MVVKWKALFCLYHWFSKGNSAPGDIVAMFGDIFG